MTFIVRSALVMNGPLKTEQRRAYAPLVENKAVVFAAFVLPKVTTPGPLNGDHMILDALATVACRINPTPAGTLAGEIAGRVMATKGKLARTTFIWFVARAIPYRS